METLMPLDEILKQMNKNW